MKRFHISISVDNFAAAVADYSARLGCGPCAIHDGRYALWRTEILNLSISCKPGQPAGLVRHIGFEDSEAVDFREERDSVGIVWEYFSQETQRAEIEEKIPGTLYRD